MLLLRLSLVNIMLFPILFARYRAAKEEWDVLLQKGQDEPSWSVPVFCLFLVLSPRFPRFSPCPSNGGMAQHRAMHDADGCTPRLRTPWCTSTNTLIDCMIHTPTHTLIDVVSYDAAHPTTASASRPGGKRPKHIEQAATLRR